MGVISRDRLISIGEAARLLGVSVPTLRGWDRSGRLRALRLPSNGRRVYRESTLKCFVDALDYAHRDASYPSTCRPDAE
jgi:excisionase family DNA binding protein